jgi:hypothetical protein
LVGSDSVAGIDGDSARWWCLPGHRDVGIRQRGHAVVCRAGDDWWRLTSCGRRRGATIRGMGLQQFRAGSGSLRWPTQGGLQVAPPGRGVLGAVTRRYYGAEACNATMRHERKVRPQGRVAELHCAVSTGSRRRRISRSW